MMVYFNQDQHQYFDYDSYERLIDKLSILAAAGDKEAKEQIDELQRYCDIFTDSFSILCGTAIRSVIANGERAQKEVSEDRLRAICMAECALPNIIYLAQIHGIPPFFMGEDITDYDAITAFLYEWGATLYAKGTDKQ